MIREISPAAYNSGLTIADSPNSSRKNGRWLDSFGSRTRAIQRWVPILLAIMQDRILISSWAEVAINKSALSAPAANKSS